MPRPSSPASPDEPAESLPPPPSTRATETSGLDLAAGSLPVRRTSAPAPSPTPPRRTTLFVVIAAATVLGVAAAGGAFLLLRGSTAELLRMTPADADLVVVAHLDPAAGQKVQLAHLRATVPSLATSTALDGRLRSVLDDLLAGTGLRGDDVVGWIGSELAFVADVVDGETRVAGLFHVGDRDGAQTMLAKLATPGSPWDGLEWRDRELDGNLLRVADTATDVTVAYAFVDDVLVIADDEDLVVRIVDTVGERRASIDATSAFQEAEAELPDDRLLLAYANPSPFVGGEALGPGSVATGLPQLLGVGELEAVRGVGLAVSARPEGFVVDVVVRYYTSRLYGPLRERLAAADEAHAIVPVLPADAWGVLAVRHADVAWRSFHEAIGASDPSLAEDLDRVGLSGLSAHAAGDAALVFLGDDPAGAVLVMEIDDDVTTRDDLDAMMRQLVSPVTGTLGIRHEVEEVADQVRWRSREDDGTVVTWANRGDPPVAFAVRDGLAVVGVSRGRVVRVLEASSSAAGLSDHGPFRRAIRPLEVADGLVYVDPRQLMSVVRRAIPREDRTGFDEDVAPDLRSVRSVAAGITADEHGQHLRLVMTVGAEE